MSDTSRPLVSVIMPFLNVAPFLEEAIESVRAQTYPHWELLLCDDASTDGSSAIARRYASLDPSRIRHLTHDDGATHGASAARNLGLRSLRGELVALLDGDDVWLPNKLEEQVAIMNERPDADALYGDTLYWYGWTGVPEDAARDFVPDAGVASGTLLAPRELITRLLRHEIMSPCTCSMILRADAVRRSGGFVEEFRHIYTDQSFYARLSLVASVLYVDRCWDRYRRHAASAYATVQRQGESRAARSRFLAWLDGYLRTRRARSGPGIACHTARGAPAPALPATVPHRRRDSRRAGRASPLAVERRPYGADGREDREVRIVLVELPARQLLHRGAAKKGDPREDVAVRAHRHLPGAEDVAEQSRARRRRESPVVGRRVRIAGRCGSRSAPSRAARLPAAAADATARSPIARRR